MINIENSCCFTGYRPEKFDFPFEESCPEYRRFYGRLMTAIAEVIEKGCTVFYCGMAQGFDIVAGEHVALVKKLNPDIKLIAAVPFRGQENGWSTTWQKRYRDLLSECDEVVTLSEGYARWVFDHRNRYMVDRSRYVVTFFDGKQGGTDNTIKYAVKHSRDIINVFETDPVEDIVSRFRCVAQLYLPEE